MADVRTCEARATLKRDFCAVTKVKVKLSLCLTKYHAMKAYWVWRYGFTHSLISALDGGEWSASRPGRLTPRE